jgi:hypothetical protein
LNSKEQISKLDESKIDDEEHHRKSTQIFGSLKKSRKQENCKIKFSLLILGIKLNISCMNLRFLPISFFLKIKILIATIK